MGLDITAYRKLEVAPAARPYWKASDDDLETYLYFYANSDFPGSDAGLDCSVGYVRPTGEALENEMDFRAGSYSGYNWWRDHLCQMAHGMTAKQFWELNTPPVAFRELINFADNEGVIGPVIAAKLAKDFADYQERADAYSTTIDNDGNWWHTAYNQWRLAFEMAADGGAVVFH